MTTQRMQLMPGVYLTTVRTKKFKSSYWALQLMTPLKEETAAMNAVLPHVLRRGSARLPDLESISAELDDMYGGAIAACAHKFGDGHSFGFEATFLDDAFVPDDTSILDRAAGLLGDMLLRPATKNGRLRQDYVAGEKENLIRRIRREKNDKRLYVRSCLVKEMFAGTDYAVGRFGTLEQAEKITHAKLFSYYQTVLETARIELFYCGSATEKRVEMAWREALMGLPRSMQRYEPFTDVSRSGWDNVREFTRELDVQQGKLEMGFRLGFDLSDPMYPAVIVANALFGGSTSSRLFLHVRERLGLCYYASSSLSSVKGLAFVSCGVDFDKFGQAKDEILRQLDELKRGEFTQEEFEQAKAYAVRGLRSDLDDQSAICFRWHMFAAVDLPFDLPQLIAAVEDVTAGQVAAAAMEMELDSICYLRAPAAEDGGEQE